MVRYTKWGVKMNEQHEYDMKSNNKLEKLIILLSVLLVIFGILTVFLLVKMYKIDNTLNKLSYIINSEISEYENEDLIDIFTEETEIPESNLPIYDELSSGETTIENTTTGNISNDVTIKNETTSKQNNVTEAVTNTTSTDSENKVTYVINTNSKKIHYAQCSFVNRMKEENKQTIKLSKNELKNYLENGYTFCSTCGG